MKALITGVTGQDGSYLSELLLGKGYEVHGLVRRSSLNNCDRIRGIESKIHLHSGDVSDSECLSRLIHEIKPDECYNLAAQSEVGVSFISPSYTAEVNALGPLRLLEAIRLHCPTCRFYQASTSEIYGNAAESPQSEDTKYSPTSPYAIAKLHAFWTTVYFRGAYNIHASNGILFNHESPRRGENFVTRKIAMGVGRIAKGDSRPVLLGNLNAKRDWGFAGDYVEAMWLMTQRESPDDFVIATGESHSVREFCELAFDTIGIKVGWRDSGLREEGFSKANGKTVVAIDPQYYRPTDIHNLIGDTGKAKRVLGWAPKMSFPELVRIMVENEVR